MDATAHAWEEWELDLRFATNQLLKFAKPILHQDLHNPAPKHNLAPKLNPNLVLKLNLRHVLRFSTKIVLLINVLRLGLSVLRTGNRETIAMISVDQGHKEDIVD